MIENIAPKHWETKKFEDLLDYIQPTNYIVESTDYSDNYHTPVLTAGKTFILGKTNETNGIYNSLPVIIFDDFTTAIKFVNFPFKVKSSAMKILKPKDESVNIKFVFYYMQTVRVTYDTHKRYWISVFSKLPIPMPPPAEQLTIVSKIEELLSDLENGKQQLLTAQQQLKVYRQSLLKAAFEGRLNCDSDDLYDEHENSTHESQNNHNNQGSDNLPKGWKRVKFGTLFNETPQNGLYKPSTEYGSGTRIIRIDGFYNGIILTDYDYKKVKLTSEETKKYLLSIGDILVNRVNSMSHLGKCGLVKTLIEPTVFESNVMKIRLNTDLANTAYVTYYLTSKKGIKELTKNAKHAVNQASINQTDVANSIIPICSIQKQQQIVDELESKLTVCDKIEETITNSLLQAESLRQSILKKAFEGKLI